MANIAHDLIQFCRQSVPDRKTIVQSIFGIGLFCVVLSCAPSTVAMRPQTPPEAFQTAALPETVGLHAPFQFSSQLERVNSGPFRYDFALGRGGAPMVKEIIQNRFARVVETSSPPPYQPGQYPDIHGVLVPSWTDLSMAMTGDQMTIAVVMEIVLLDRQGQRMWSRTLTGQSGGKIADTAFGEEGCVDGASARDCLTLDEHAALSAEEKLHVNPIPCESLSEQCRGAGRVDGEEYDSALVTHSTKALETIGASLVSAFSSHDLVALIESMRNKDKLAKLVQEREERRKSARMLYVHPFVVVGANLENGVLFQSELVSHMLGSGQFVATVTKEQEARLAEALLEVNRDETDPEEWVKIGQGRGAELMLAGEVATSEGACSVKAELTDLESRLIRASFFRSLSSCTPEELSLAAEQARKAMEDGL